MSWPGRRVPLDPGTRGPAVDTALETGTPLVFAAGNLVPRRPRPRTWPR